MIEGVLVQIASTHPPKRAHNADQNDQVENPDQAEEAPRYKYPDDRADLMQPRTLAAGAVGDGSHSYCDEEAQQEHNT